MIFAPASHLLRTASGVCCRSQRDLAAGRQPIHGADRDHRAVERGASRGVRRRSGSVNARGDGVVDVEHVSEVLRPWRQARSSRPSRVRPRPRLAPGCVPVARDAVRDHAPLAPVSVFLALPPSAWVASNALAFAVRDAFPVSPGHTLVVTRRVVPDWFSASEAERAAVIELVERVKRDLDGATPRPDGYNVGFNAGEAAGQTVMHLHVHVIHRHRGDVPDPRGKCACPRHSVTKSRGIMRPRRARRSRRASTSSSATPNAWTRKERARRRRPRSFERRRQGALSCLRDR
jgi:diadenosine tetraphosphate (Ap4A) HIT family hydrolase